MGKLLKFSVGHRFPGTQLSYVGEAPRKTPLRRRVFASCDCGNHRDYDLASITHCNTKSCGCLRAALMTEKNISHGCAKSSGPSGAYRSWQAMHQRVSSSPNYKHIDVCPRWSGSDGFKNFLEDMGERPIDFSIERLNNAGNYEPENCVWADRFTQARNSRNATPVTIDGQTKCIHEWCEHYKIDYSLVKKRRRKGMSLEEALYTPINLNKSRKKKDDR